MGSLYSQKMEHGSRLISFEILPVDRMMAFSQKKMKKYPSPLMRQIEESPSMQARCQDQKKKRDSSVDSLSTRILFSSDGMNIEIRSSLSTLTKKTVVVITISSVNHEEVNPSSSATSLAKISGLVKASVSSIHMETS